MYHLATRIALAASLLLGVSGLFQPLVQADPLTALDRYVSQRDGNSHYTLARTVDDEKTTAHVLDLVSQTWLTTNEVDRTEWHHWLTIITPKTVAHRTGLLFITGGDNGKPAPEKPDGNLVRIAQATRSVVAELRMVPNQPLVFNGENRTRQEDAIIAYSWDKYLRTGDERWPLRLPMTRSAASAMDAITRFCATPEGGSNVVERFVVCGGSKRGWTTWSIAAVDKRVEAIIPLVIDLLNIEPSFRHHYEVYGFFAPAVHDYLEMDTMNWLGSPENRGLLAIEDPYSYRDRLTLPKFMINASGDQFFLPDSAQFYFDALSGPKFLRYVPNTDHSLKESDAFQSVLACYSSVLHHTPLPEFSFKLEKDGRYQVTARTTPKEVKLWQATNPKARDFRLETIGPAWQSTTLAASDGWRYEGRVETPKEGWTGFFVELTFDGPGPVPFKFTSDVRVVPDKVLYRFEPKKPAR